MGPLQAKAIAVRALLEIDPEWARTIGNLHDSKVMRRWIMEQFEANLDRLLGITPVNAASAHHE